MLKVLEGVRHEPYKDSGGKETIGVGHVIHEFDHYIYPLTDQQVNDLLKSDLKEREQQLTALLPNVTQNQFDALLMLVFNIGIGNFEKSTVYRTISRGSYSLDTLRNAWLMWTHANNQIDQGLVNRRNFEIDLYLNGHYTY